MPPVSGYKNVGELVHTEYYITTYSSRPLKFLNEAHLHYLA